ncbi:ABC transporter permease subunit [Allonocardiopsis opalescens]|uniref:Peptide/nickel transport system permease protein n=1 Tax=Allonocardiopsis opalescens TaxID=1144618 RepID=A0A2T0QES7_9ACTN|nr:ABC transporter permease subunit [Allonocardiopsis opalescens]PRY02429.1 peptide/nickel transport system permease protein [Allonocardiopsis opalescens]
MSAALPGPLLLGARLLRGPAVLAGSCAALVLAVAALPWLSGEDPAHTVLRARSAEREPDPAALAAVRAELDLPADPVAGTLGWLGGALRGDLGASWVTGAPVAPTVLGATGVSAGLAACAALVALATAVAVLAPALWRAARTGRAGGDGAAATGALLGSVPDFLLAAVLLAVVAVRWGLAPTSGWSGPANVPLPALALGLPAGGLLSRVLAGALDAAAAEGWVRTWRAAAFGRWTLAVALLRRALAVALPQVLLLFIGLLGGAVTVETVFAVPGLGDTALSAVLAQDLPLVQGCVTALVAMGLAVGGAGVIAHRLLMGPALVPGALAPAVPRGRRRHDLAPALVAAVLLAAVAAGLLRDPAATSLADRLAAPSLAHPLGTDAVGRDLLARFGHGALLSVGTGVAVSAVALVVGLLVGLAAARARAGAGDVLNAVPPVLMGVLVASVTGPGPLGAAAAVALVAWIPLAVHARTLAAEVRAAGFFQAAVAGGAGRGRLLRRHLLPSVLPGVARHALVRVPHNTLALAGLSFLGLGAGHDSPEWGAMLAEVIGYVERAPWTVAVPAAGLGLLGVVAGLVRTDRV